MGDQEEYDYKRHANDLKDEGNEAFASGDNERAIQLYSQAIAVDPDNHVLYSNRSAAYMKVDSISKALRDAEKCVEIAPKWVKGYNRLGAAQHGLKRFEHALETIQKGLELEPSNQSLWTLLRTVQEAANVDKKERYEIAAKERAQEEARIRAKDLARANAAAAAAAAVATVATNAPILATAQAIPTSAGTANVVNEDAAFSAFFSDIDKPESIKSSVVTSGTTEEDAALAAFFI